MTARTPAWSAARNGGQRLSGDLGRVGTVGGQLVVRVGGDVAVPGEVLDAGRARHAGRLESADPSGGVPGDQFRGRTEGPDPDDGVVGVGVDVRTGGVVQAHPGGAQLAAQVGGDGLGQLRVVDGAEGEVARARRAGRPLHPGDVARLLVDGDDELGVLRAESGGQPDDLVGGGDVAGEEHDGRQPVADLAQDPVGRLRADESRLQDGERESAQLAAVLLGGHRPRLSVRPVRRRRQGTDSAPPIILV